MKLAIPESDVIFICFEDKVVLLKGMYENGFMCVFYELF